MGEVCLDVLSYLVKLAQLMADAPWWKAHYHVPWEVVSSLTLHWVWCAFCTDHRTVLR